MLWNMIRIFAEFYFFWMLLKYWTVEFQGSKNCKNSIVTVEDVALIIVCFICWVGKLLIAYLFIGTSSLLSCRVWFSDGIAKLIFKPILSRLINYFLTEVVCLILDSVLLQWCVSCLKLYLI